MQSERKNKKRKGKQRKGKERKEKKRKEKERKENENRKSMPFGVIFNEKPSVVPRCTGVKRYEGSLQYSSK